MTLEEFLEDEEDFIPYAYQDSKGYWTIGIGTLIDKDKGGRITLEEARYLLANRVRPIYLTFDREIPWWTKLNSARQTILVSMAYQIGITGFFKFKNTLAAIKRGDFVTAKKGMLASKWAREDSPARARRAADIMERGEW